MTTPILRSTPLYKEIQHAFNTPIWLKHKPSHGDMNWKDACWLVIQPNIMEANHNFQKGLRWETLPGG